MHNRMTYLRTLRRKASVTVEAHYRLSDGCTRPGERMDEYEDPGRRRDLTLVALYQSPARFVQHGLTWCSYDRCQAEFDFQARDVMRRPRQLVARAWTSIAVS